MLLGSDLDVLEPERLHRRALIIDDESDTISLLKHIMINAGIDVASALDGPTALDLITRTWPDVILLDLMIPGMDGWEIFQELRRLTNAPVMIVSALSDKEDIVRGLHIGADDYITKPFYPSELVARINRVTSLRKMIKPSQVFKFPAVGLEIDSNTREVTYNGKVSVLPPREFGVLSSLARRPGQWVDLGTIAAEVWGDTNVHIQNRIKYLVFLLRSHIEKDSRNPRLLLSREGLGYKLAVTQGPRAR
jgi:DNA-binding response OmpR family regulator